MESMLPLNRKEKYWTSCVLPAIICGENKFSDLKEFLKLIKVPEKFLKESYESEEIDFYTEYCLRDSAINWDETRNLSGETPDLVVILRNESELALIFVEAKMYDKVTYKKIRIQLNKQKNIANVIMKKLEISEENFIHVALFLEEPLGFKPFKNEIVINWKQICQVYQMKSNNYFYRQLDTACKRIDLMSKGAESYGENCTQKLNYKKIVDLYKKKGNFYVGRNGNIDQVENDCLSGKIKTYKYEINTKLNPSSDKAPGLTGKNWFRATEFIKLLKKNNIL